MLFRKSALACAVAACALPLSPAHAGFEPFLGQIMTTGSNFCPRGSVPAEGQLLPISQNTALFSLLGIMYGGDGRSNFGLPNLQGRAPIGRGQGPGLPDYAQGQPDGTTTIQLTTTNMPSHSHAGTLRAQSAAGNSNSPVRNSLATAPAGTNVYSTATPANNMNAGDINVLANGGGQAIANESPYLAVTYCIVTQGVFPPRP